MVQSDKILKGFRVTEKAAKLQASNQYTFAVAEDANGVAISQAVEETFNVKVERVNVINVKGKRKVSRIRKVSVGIKGKIKKAIVTLKKGDSIQVA